MEFTAPVVSNADISLFADWQCRQRRLQAFSATQPHISAQLRILDYLIQRYTNAALAQRPARFPLPQAPLQNSYSNNALFLNHRAMLVHHHLRNVGRPQTATECAGDNRVVPVIHRLSSRCSNEAVPSTGLANDTSEPDCGLNFFRHVLTLMDSVADYGTWVGRCMEDYARLKFALRLGPDLSDETVAYLGRCAENPSGSAVLSIALMICCDNPRVIDHAVAAWRTRISANLKDDAARMLEEMLSQPLRRARAADLFRYELASSQSAVRLRALYMTEKLGTLHDIGLLMDLIALPKQSDEAPRERDAILRATCELSGARSIHMHATTEKSALTNYEDWQLRRKRLNSYSGSFRRQYIAAESRIYDYLLDHHHHSARGQQLARFAMPSEVFTDRGSVVVYHQLGKTEFAGVKTEQEASKRASSILRRMASMDLQSSAKAYVDAGRVKTESEAPILIDAATRPTPQQLEIWKRIENELVIRGTKSHCNLVFKEIGEALSLGPMLPEKAVYYLNCQIVNSEAIEYLARCQNRSAMDYILGEWRKRIRKRKLGVQPNSNKGLVERLGPARAHLFFSTPERRSAAAEKFRREILSADHPRIRLAAIRILGRVGGLEDISLLSDILSLPRLRNEDPRERPALLQSMKKLARRNNSDPVVLLNVAHARTEKGMSLSEP